MKKRFIASVVSTLMLLSMTACKDSPSSSVKDAVAKDSYTVGICQIVQHPALDAATAGFKDALKEKLGDKVIFDEQNASGDTATCAVIANQFVSSGVDLIMANATPALQAAQTATNDIPVLGTSVTDYGTALDMDGFTGITGKNISGTADLAPLDQQALVFKELFPDLKKVGIVYCSAEPNSKFQAKLITGYLEELGYECKEYSFSDSNDIHAVVTTAVTESEVLYLPTDNSIASNAEIVKNIALPARVPSIAGEEGICRGAASVATLSISYYDLGYTTGEMAYEVLVNGANPAEMEIQYASTVTKLYNPESCEALGITPPDGYERLNMDSE